MEERIRNQCDINMIEVAGSENNKDQMDGIETTTVKQKKKKTLKQHLLKCFDNFNLSSKEVKERERTPIEKIIWLIMFLLCFSYCGCLIWKSYWKWISSPAIVLLTENADYINKIPFPAVTVCPERKIKSSVFTLEKYDYIDLDTYNETFGNITEKDLHMYEDMIIICKFSEIPEDCDEEIESIGRKFSTGNETVVNIIKASPALSTVMHTCYLKGRACKKMFKPILTEEGVCYTFNMIDDDDPKICSKLINYKYMENFKILKGWTPGEGYAPDAPKKTYPQRSTGAGAEAGLSLTLGQDKGGLEYYWFGMTGFKILLHHPMDLPRPSQQTIRIGIEEDVTIAFTPKMIFTSDGLRVFPPDRRQCYFTGEYNLKYFKLYSQSNCEFECLTNFTYARCDCVGFGMPHQCTSKTELPEVRLAPILLKVLQPLPWVHSICDQLSIIVAFARNFVRVELVDLSMLGVNNKLEQGSSNVTVDEAIQIANDCRCLPSCTSVTYDTEISKLAIDTNREYEMRVMNYDFKYKHPNSTSDVDIFFKSAKFEISKRSELYTTSDILASCGGLLGLFMGFSVINFIETLYFCILRAAIQRRIKAENHEFQ